MSSAYRIRRLEASDARAAVPALADILLDCIAGGASVNFMADTTREQAEAFWRQVVDAGDGRVLLVAEDEAGPFGTVQLIPAAAPNQPHRADVAKMLVARRGRNRGVGDALMAAVEDAAREMGRTLLVLDTVTGAAGERLYTRRGWSRVGEIPNFALMPDGAFCDTTFFYKALG